MAKKLKMIVEIDMSGPAFGDVHNGNEAGRILRTLATRIEGVWLMGDMEPYALLDERGKVVGQARFEGQAKEKG